MMLSRWKMMAGVLGVSLGGLVAVAGQCPKSDPGKSAPPPPDMPVVSPPVLPGATPAVPPPASTLPPLPSSEPVKVPSMPVSSPPALPVVPASGSVPPPAPDLPPEKSTLPPPASSVPPVPAPGDLLPAGKPMPPATPPAPVDPPVRVTPPIAGSTAPPAPPDLPSGALPLTPPSSGTSPGVPSRVPSADPLIGSVPDHPPMAFTKPADPVPAGVAAGVASKYRILLRVGEGEPTFEVRCGDDLMLKVICEKVDVKSPEKGHGLSAVKASGKVRFAGFGAEGTCDELAFLAGTGEVAMTGSVKIHVKDKLGRIESELSTETMKYKIDPSAISGALKP